MTLQKVAEVRELVSAWQEPAVWRLGPRIAASWLTWLMCCWQTGGRIGEVLALRWCDLDLDADPPTVTFAGTMVYVQRTRSPAPGVYEDRHGAPTVV